MKNEPAHHQFHKGHQIDWDSTHIIDQDKYYLQRKVKEALYINALNPGQNVTSLMNLEKGENIDSCWDQFIPDVRSRVEQQRSRVKLKKDQAPKKND